MNAGRAFSYMFEDRRWPEKLLIGVLWVFLSILIPVIGSIIGTGMLNGYLLEMVRNISNGNDGALPEWDNLGDKFVRGIVLLAIQLVWAIPFIVLSGIVSFASAALYANTSAAVQGFATFWIAIFWVLMAAYGILLLFILPVSTARYATTWDFGSAFDVSHIFSVLSNNLGNYVIVVLLSIVAGIIASLGIIACFVGVFFTSFYSYVVIFALYGLAYRAALGRGPGATA